MIYAIASLLPRSGPRWRCLALVFGRSMRASLDESGLIFENTRVVPSPLKRVVSGRHRLRWPQKPPLRDVLKVKSVHDWGQLAARISATLRRLNRTHGVRKAPDQNAGHVFHRSLGTAGQLDMTQDAAINGNEESASFPSAIPKGGQRCQLSN